MKKIILISLAVVVVGLAGLAYRQYQSYQTCKQQSRDAALFVYPNDPAHPDYAAKRATMEANFIKQTCHKFGFNLGT